jgi:SAM-dependent methyltransferase
MLDHVKPGPSSADQLPPAGAGAAEGGGPHASTLTGDYHRNPGAESMEQAPRLPLDLTSAKCYAKTKKAYGQFRVTRLPRRRHRFSLFPRQDYFLQGHIISPGQQKFSSVEVYANGKWAGSTGPLKPREDIAKVFPWHPHAELSGYELWVKGRSVKADRINRLQMFGLQGENPVESLEWYYRTDLETAVPVPPPKLMARVAGTDDANWFRTSGLTCYGQYVDAVSRHRDLRSVRRLLDWGCGCGRMTAHFLLHPGGPEVHGCDIDPESIAWCRTHLGRGSFSQTALMPPLPYEDATFDVVISYSVFTHLTRDVQNAWLAELRRVVPPGGLVLASVYGRFGAGITQPPDKVADLLQNEFTDELHDPALDEVIEKGYYRATIQAREYTVREWAKYFEVVEYVEGGVLNILDLVVMRRAA